MSKFLNISTDTTLGGNSASDEVVSSQKAIKAYVDSHGGGGSYTAGTGIDITNDVISVASPTLTNSSTFSSSVGIFSDFGQHGYSSVGIGYSSKADSSGTVALGYMARAVNSYATALGYQATAGGYCSIQLGYGSNNTRDKFNVGFFRGTDSQSHNWEMLDGTTGLIPDERMSSNIARTSSIPTVDQTYSASSTNAQSGTAVAEAISDRANTELSNLTSTGKNIANWSSNVTNCITEIPQDIKLELNNGTLTLKAGSKVYVPNGVGVFDVVNVSSDINLARNSSGLYFVFMKSNGVSSDTMPISYCYSGNSQPAITHTYAIWYDTANNKIKWTKNNGSTWVDGYSLPMCIVVNDTPGTRNVSSIDQVFNGFGYIGSTVFALPGVKGLIPNGRNADGSLKNIEFTVSSVLTSTNTFSNYPNSILIGDTDEFNNKINQSQFLGCFDSAPAVTGDWGSYYNTSENQMYFNYSSKWNKTNRLVCANIYVANFKITSFTPKTTFHALDYSDSSTISGWSMPSSRYDNLTLGASGANYTAPANGYFCLDKAGTQNEYIDIRNNTTGLLRSKTTISAPGIESIAVYMPCKKGDEIAVVYTATGTTNRFRFIYAEGENV